MSQKWLVIAYPNSYCLTKFISKNCCQNTPGRRPTEKARRAFKGNIRLARTINGCWIYRPDVDLVRFSCSFATGLGKRAVTPILEGCMGRQVKSSLRIHQHGYTFDDLKRVSSALAQYSSRRRATISENT